MPPYEVPVDPPHAPLRTVGLARDPELDPVTRALKFDVELNRWPTETEARYLRLEYGPHSGLTVSVREPVSNETPSLGAQLEDAEALDAAIGSLKKHLAEASRQGKQTDLDAANELKELTDRLDSLLANG